jgi:hypothetical protein
LDLRKSNFFSSKFDLWISGLVLLVPLVLWYFWYFWYTGFLVLLVLCETRVSLSREIQPLKRCTESAKLILRGGHTFLDGFGAEKLHHQKALIFMYDNSDVFHL